MKKYYLFFILLFITISLEAADWKKFGLSGKCHSASSENEILRFDDEGNLIEFTLKTSVGSVESQSLTTTYNGFEGECYVKEDCITGYYILIIESNGISSLYVTYENNDELTTTITCTYLYDSNGLLIKRTDEKIWSEYIDNYYYRAKVQELEKEAQEIMKNAYKMCNKHPNDAKKNNKILKEAEKRATNILSQKDNIPLQIIIEKNINNTVYFSNYEIDNYNNWISRGYTSNNSYTYKNEKRKIEYTHDFTDNSEWEKIKNSGDLKAVEEFAKSYKTSYKYETIAIEYWNSHILEEVEKVYNNDIKILCDVYLNSIANEEIKQKALTIIRKNAYENIVLIETDFTAVMKMTSMTIRGIDIFDDNYKTLIELHSNKLRQDSIKKLIDKAENELLINQLPEACNTANNILFIDNDNNRAKEILAEAYFGILEEKEYNGTITYEDYISFFEINKGSKYDIIVGNKLTKYALSQENYYIKNNLFYEYYYYLSNIENNYQMDDEINNSLRSKMLYIKKKADKKQKIDHFWGLDNKNHGKLIGFGGEGTVGYTLNNFDDDMRIGLFGFYFRFGYLSGFINGYTGILLDCRGYNYDAQGRLTFPLMLRCNFLRESNHAFYLAGGMQLSIPLVNSKNDVLKNIRTNNQFFPRISIGYAGKHSEIELYGIIENKAYYNKDKLIDAGIDKIIDSESFDKATNNYNRFHLGLAVRFYIVK